MLNEILERSSTSSTTQVVASDDARKPAALAPHLRRPASTTQVVVSSDTAPVLPPHLRKPTASAPHLHKPASATQVVVSNDTAPVLLPHLRKPTASAPHLHKPASATKVPVSDNAVPTLNPHLRLLDIEQVEAKREKEWQEIERKNIMRHTCPDNLVFGKKCRTEADCIYLYKICPDYKRSPELCNLPFMHDRGDDTFVHIKPTCVNVTNNRPCPRQPGCPFGHDFETLRKALHQHRLRIARRNTMLNGWRTHQARVRQESIKGQTGEHATGRR